MGELSFLRHHFPFRSYLLPIHTVTVAMAGTENGPVRMRVKYCARLTRSCRLKAGLRTTSLSDFSAHLAAGGFLRQELFASRFPKLEIVKPEGPTSTTLT